MLKIGHRGAAGYELENTIASFKKAIEIGVDMIELDVVLCKTGEAMVIHDQTVDRTTNDKGFIKELTFEQIKEIKTKNNETIPTLDEVIDLIDQRCQLNIELKGKDSAGVVSDVIQKRFKMGWKPESFLVSSFNHIELLEFKRLCLSVRIGALIKGIPVGYGLYFEKLSPWSVHISGEFITGDFVNDLHSRSMKVLVYTVNHYEEIQYIKDFGVDGIFSDFPDRL
jgi:glycerophosphoryl diester phosphodiesterase